MTRLERQLRASIAQIQEAKPMTQIAGSIGTDRKPRRKLTLADKVAALDTKIARASKLKAKLEAAKGILLNAAIEHAKAALAEAEQIK